MTTFSVSIPSLVAFGDDLSFWSGRGTTNSGLAKARQYVEDHVAPAGDRSGHLFFTFASAADQVQAKLDSRLARLADVFGAAGDEVVRLAKHYDSDDNGVADELEKTHAAAEETGSGWEPLQSPQPGIGAAWSHDPTVYLEYPTGSDAVPDLVRYIFTDRGMLLKGNILPLVNKAIDLIWCDWGGHATNPIEQATKWLVGDWNAASVGSEALSFLGDYHGRLAGALMYDVTSLADTWKGKSATAAEAYFYSLASAISEMDPALKSVSNDYRTVATGMWMEAQGFAGAIPAIVTLGTAIAATAAATAATAATGVGAVLGAIGLGAEAIAFIRMVMIAWNCWCAMIALVDVFVGTCAGFAGAIHSVDTIDKVAAVTSNYDNPFV